MAAESVRFDDRGVRIERVEFRETVRVFFPPGTKQSVCNNEVSVLIGCP